MKDWIVQESIERMQRYHGGTVVQCTAKAFRVPSSSSGFIPLPNNMQILLYIIICLCMHMMPYDRLACFSSSCRVLVIHCNPDRDKPVTEDEYID